jgi:uncharacterized damage-inducible protein DinB
MVPEGVRRYLRHGLAATPIVLERLCVGVTEQDLDRRPDPERFTLREALAHLADWEGVWLDRMTRMRREDHPFLESFDEGQWAIDHDYAHSNAAEQLIRFRAGREKISALLNELTDDEWERTGNREEIGSVTILDFAVLVLGHDGYHLRQFVEYRPIN